MRVAKTTELPPESRLSHDVKMIVAPMAHKDIPQSTACGNVEPNDYVGCLKKLLCPPQERSLRNPAWHGCDAIQLFQALLQRTKHAEIRSWAGLGERIQLENGHAKPGRKLLAQGCFARARPA